MIIAVNTLVLMRNADYCQEAKVQELCSSSAAAVPCQA